jgi:hypothetical protein
MNGRFRGLRDLFVILWAVAFLALLWLTLTGRLGFPAPY